MSLSIHQDGIFSKNYKEFEVSVKNKVEKVLNQTLFTGRCFIGNFSVPWGHTLSSPLSA